MKIIVLHGDDTAKSYARLTKFIDSAKKRGWEIVTDDFPKTTSLFGKDRLIIYRDFRLLTKKEIQNFDKFEGTLVIYHDGVLPQTFIKQMPQDFKLEKFELPQVLFTFLESFYPGNDGIAIKLLHKVVHTQAIELVFFMLSKHMKDLYWVSLDTKSNQFPSWKQAKLKSQASKFKANQLNEIIGILSEIDITVKSSQANLLTELDLMVVKQLK